MDEWTILLDGAFKVGTGAALALGIFIGSVRTKLTLLCEAVDRLGQRLNDIEKRLTAHDARILEIERGLRRPPQTPPEQ